MEATARSVERFFSLRLAKILYATAPLTHILFFPPLVGDQVYSKECIATCNDAYVAFECPKPWDGKGIDLCMKSCFPTEPSCDPLNADLGSCNCELGYRVDESGQCSLIIGCPTSVPTGVEFFATEEECVETCGSGPTCDVVDVCALGLCDFILGWGIDQSGMCVEISGCPGNRLCP